jgi:hypothetical protein
MDLNYAPEDISFRKQVRPWLVTFSDSPRDSR